MVGLKSVLKRLRGVSRWGTICGVFALLVLATGCDPCLNNPCDDGLACNGVEVCTTDGLDANCTPGNPLECTEPEVCSNQAGGCVDPCLNVDCSDGDVCTDDVCTFTANEETGEFSTTCSNPPVVCDDGDACTENDACDSEGEEGNCAGSPIECAAGEVCADGVCVCADDTGCDDGDICTGTETCDVETGECVAGTPVDCDDGEFCNGAETCEANDETGEADCVAGTDPCAEGEICDEDDDTCSAPPSCTADADCDDEDVCTDNACTDGACETTNNTADCDDGDACTENDVCADGACAGTDVTCPAGESCDAANGDCVPVDCTSDADCADGLACTTNTCNQATGACIISNENDLCHDGLHCTGDDSGDVCDPDDEDAGSDGCVRDGDPCSGTTPICNESTDSCDKCASVGDCDDGFSCTNDTCENDGSCTNANVTANCDNPDFCDGVDVCDPDHEDADADGCYPPGSPCTGVTPVCDEDTETCSACESNTDCDDGFSCTDDTCDGGSGECTSTKENDNCGDADFCDGVDVCDPDHDDADAAGCYGPGNPCGGNSPVCDESDNSCNACESNLDCDDGFDCTSETCDGGSGACTYAEDDAECTDVCAEGLGCVECKVNGDCDDGLFCTGVETCDAGTGVCNASPGDPCSGTTPICDEGGDSCNGCANDAECQVLDAAFTCQGDNSCS